MVFTVFKSVWAGIVMAISSVGLVGCVGGPDTPSYYQSLERPDAQIDQQVVAAMISSYRAQQGLGSVVAASSLGRAAAIKAQSLATTGGSNLSGREGGDLAERLEAVGELNVYAVENTSAGYRRWAEAFSGWRDSPRHRAMMLDPKITRIGIATAYAPQTKYKVFWSLVGAE